jgi:hypothetical protein
MIVRVITRLVGASKFKNYLPVSDRKSLPFPRDLPPGNPLISEKAAAAIIKTHNPKENPAKSLTILLC